MSISETSDVEAAQRKRWSDRSRLLILLLLVAGGLINFLDRSALSVANTTMRAALHLSGTQIGALLSTFSLAYGLAQLPAGGLLDRYGGRIVIGAGMLFWSLAQTATGLVSSFAALLLTRVGLGLGEAPFLPGGVKFIHNRYEMRERGMPMSVLNASTTVGQAIAPPLLTVLMLASGWRSMFIVIGVLGIALALLWLSLYREHHPDLTSDTQRVTSARWNALLGQRTMWGMMLGFSGVNYTAWFYLAWLPGYLETAHHVSLARTGLLAAIPYLMGTVGMLVNGLIADALVRRGFDPLRSRKLLVVCGMTSSAICTLFVIRATSGMAAALMIGFALFCIHFAGTSAWGVVQAAAPKNLVGSVGSLQNFASFLCASTAPLLTGWLLDRTHSFHTALSICALITLFGAVAYLVLVDDPLTVDRLEHAC